MTCAKGRRGLAGWVAEHGPLAVTRMNCPLSPLSKGARRLLTCFLIVPWLAFAIVGLDLLPASWRFEHWSPSLRNISVAAFVLFFIAEVSFEIWYWVVTSKDGTRENK